MDRLSFSGAVSDTGVSYHGEIVSWACSGGVPQDLLEAALTAYGFPLSYATPVSTRTAASRAIKELADDKIVEVLESTDSKLLRFQFTRSLPVETDGESRFDHEFDCIVTINLDEGTVSCDKPEMNKLAADFLVEKMKIRTAADITAIIQKLFKDSADIWPIRERGGCYFVPAIHAEFLNRVSSVVKEMGGRIRRYKITAGDSDTDESIRQSAIDKADEMLDELFDSVSKFSSRTRSATMAATFDRAKNVKSRLEFISEYLGSEKERLDEKLRQVQTAMKDAATAVLAGEDGSAPF